MSPYTFPHRESQRGCEVFNDAEPMYPKASILALILKIYPSPSSVTPTFHKNKIITAGPSSPRVGRVLTGNTFSLSDHNFLSRPPLPRLSINQAPPVRFTPSPRWLTPVRNSLRRRSPAPLPRASDAPELIQPSLITLPP
jgi:hypothetical protein